MMIRTIAITLGFVALTGCATPAQISMPTVQKVVHTAYENKTIKYDVLYSQPKPGMLSGGEQQPMQPIENAELSVASAKTLTNIRQYIQDQLPNSSKLLKKGESDLDLVIRMKAFHKKGPAYADFEGMKSFGKSLLTFGLASNEYDIIADFEVTYDLTKNGQILFSKDYKVKESVDHERGKLDGFNELNVYAAELLEKHLIITLNDFFGEAANKL